MSKKPKPQDHHQKNNHNEEGDSHSKSHHMSSLTLLWKYLSQDDLDTLEKSNLLQCEKHFAKIFKLTEYNVDLLQACFLDYYFTQYWWARNKKFSKEQISVYFSLAYILMDNIKEKNMPVNENVNELMEMLANEMTKLLSEKECKLIIDHLTVTFFQNYKIYQYALKQPRKEITVSKKIEVECPKWPDLPYPAPLAEAMPEKMHNKYVLKIPDEPTAEELAKLALDNPEKMQLSEEVVAQIHDKFSRLSIEDAKRIIFEVTNELVNELKSEMKTKLRERETMLLSEVSKNQGGGGGVGKPPIKAK